MTYHSGIGNSAGLGNDNWLQTYTPLQVNYVVGGVTEGNQQGIFMAINDAVRASNKLGASSFVGFVGGGFVAYRGQFLPGSVSSSQTRYQKLQALASALKAAGAAAARTTGNRVQLHSIRLSPNGTILWRDQAVPDPTARPAAARPAAAPPAGAAFGEISVRELQQRLIASGARLAADGGWGRKTRTALEDFARARSIALPAFDTDNYKLADGKLRVPSALLAALPASGDSSGTTSTRRRTSPVPSLAPPPSDAVPPPADESGGGGGGGGGGAPWYESEMLKKAAPFAILALGGAAALFVWSRRRKPTALAAAPA